MLVSPDRIIRHVAGLRPFRRSGFNVSVDQIGEKTLIHNYGHGGGGITLSWGTANLALEHALATEYRDAAVIGCGAVGLATARLLQDHGFVVTIYARDLPPNTTSNVAGASWAPSSVFDNDRYTPEFGAQYESALRFAYRYFQTLVGPRYSVTWRENYSLSPGTSGTPGAPGAPGAGRGGRSGALLAGIRPQTVVLAPGEHPFGQMNVSRTLTMHIEPASYLQQLLEDYRDAGGRVVVNEFKDRESFGELFHPLIINCTGLGAGELFDDNDVLPIKGQLTVVAPQPEVDYLTSGPGDLYMMPRRDGIVLGGTHERDVWSLDPNPAEATRILQGHQNLFAQMTL